MNTLGSCIFSESYEFLEIRHHMLLLRKFWMTLCFSDGCLILSAVMMLPGIIVLLYIEIEIPRASVAC
jgi:uncharacterized membrane protein